MKDNRLRLHRALNYQGNYSLQNSQAVKKVDARPSLFDYEAFLNCPCGILGFKRGNAEKTPATAQFADLLSSQLTRSHKPQSYGRGPLKGNILAHKW